MDELISKKAVLELLHKLELSLNKEETIPAVLHDIEQMAGQPERKFTVNTRTCPRTIPEYSSPSTAPCPGCWHASNTTPPTTGFRPVSIS